MKGLLHWMLCHTVMIVLLLFLLTAIYFRGPLFGIWPEPEPLLEPVVETPIPSEPEPLSSTVSKAESQPPEQAADEQASLPETADETSSTNITEVTQNVIDPVEAETTPAEMPDEVEEPSPTATVQVQETAEAESVEAPVAEKVSLPITETHAELEQMQPQIPAKASSGNEMSEVVDQESLEAQRLQENYQFRPEDELPVEEADIQQDLLQQARKAYWNDDLEKARTLYQAYINLHPEDPDGYGELGNLLSTEGNLQSASYMYRKAADLLTRQGRTEEAQQLKEVLSSIEVIQNSYD